MVVSCIAVIGYHSCAGHVIWIGLGPEWEADWSRVWFLGASKDMYI